MEDNFDIQHLVEIKNFDELSVAEKKLVLKEISEVEFTQRRNLVLSMQLFLHTKVEKVNPNAAFKDSVAAIMNARKARTKNGIFQVLFLSRTPVYIPVAAAFLLVFLFPYFYGENKSVKNVAKNPVNTSSPSNVKLKPELVYKTDTIRVEKINTVYVKVPVIKYIEVVKENTVDVTNGLDVANAFENNNVLAISAPNTLVFAKELLDGQMKNLGKSSADLEELNKFLVVSK